MTALLAVAILLIACSVVFAVALCQAADQPIPRAVSCRDVLNGVGEDAGTVDFDFRSGGWSH